MKRTLATIALTAILLTGGAAAADASTYQVSPIEQTTNTRPAPFTVGVKVCIHALKWANRKPSEARADRAIAICHQNVKTKRQFAALYEWANQSANQWALEYIG